MAGKFLNKLTGVSPRSGTCAQQTKVYYCCSDSSCVPIYKSDVAQWYKYVSSSDHSYVCQSGVTAGCGCS